MRLPILYTMLCQSASSAASMHNCFLRTMSSPPSPSDHVLTCLLCLTQMGWPDMRLPILYTMSWPERVPCSEQTWPRLDFRKCSELTFKEPDHAKYPSMKLAYAAGRCKYHLCHPHVTFCPMHVQSGPLQVVDASLKYPAMELAYSAGSCPSSVSSV